MAVRMGDIDSRAIAAARSSLAGSDHFSAPEIEVSFPSQLLAHRLCPWARVESELRENLRRVTSVAEGALERARKRRAEGEAAVQEELQSIALFRRQAESLLQQTEGGGNG